MSRETMERNYGEKLWRKTVERNYEEKLWRETMKGALSTTQEETWMRRKAPAISP